MTIHPRSYFWLAEAEVEQIFQIAINIHHLLAVAIKGELAAGEVEQDKQEQRRLCQVVLDLPLLCLEAIQPCKAQLKVLPQVVVEGLEDGGQTILPLLPHHLEEAQNLVAEAEAEGATRTTHPL